MTIYGPYDTDVKFTGKPEDINVSITRKEAESLCRAVISKHTGENMPENLFKNSVDQLMGEINGENSELGAAKRRFTDSGGLGPKIELDPLQRI